MESACWFTSGIWPGGFSFGYSGVYTISFAQHSPSPQLTVPRRNEVLWWDAAVPRAGIAQMLLSPVHGPLAVLQAHAGQLHLHEKAHVVQNSTAQVEQGNVTTVVGIVMGVHPALFHSNLLFLEFSGIYWSLLQSGQVKTLSKLNSFSDTVTRNRKERGGYNALIFCSKMAQPKPNPACDNDFWCCRVWSCSPNSSGAL